LDARDGRRRWVYQRSTTNLSVRSPAGLVVAHGNAYGGFTGGKLVAIALSNGGVRWEATVALPHGTNELDRVTDVIGLPWVSEHEVCAVAYQGRIACFEASNGSSLWGREMSSVTGLGADAGYIFVSDDRGAVHALDRSSGTSVWKQDRLFRRSLTLPVPLGRQVAVGDVQGYVHLLSRDSGAFEARVATDGSPIAAAPAFVQGNFLVQTRNGNLFSLVVQ
jgi:outer membrane protein assembly factor BamB